MEIPILKNHMYDTTSKWEDKQTINLSHSYFSCSFLATSVYSVLGVFVGGGVYGDSGGPVTHKASQRKLTGLAKHKLNEVM